MVNDKFIQLHGSFKKGEELTRLIKKNFPNFKSIKKIGIQSIENNICCINGIDFIIGKTGILEFDNVYITSLFFKQDESEKSLIDCILG